MAGERPRNFRNGDLAEYLAHFVLSALGVATYVPRQNDFGIDYYAALAELKGQSIRVHSPYMVQLKSGHPQIIQYGGLRKNSTVWKWQEVDWLFGHDAPFLLGFLDMSRQQLSLYSTSFMWPLRYEHGRVGGVKFMPDSLPGSAVPTGVEITKPVYDKDELISDGKIYEVCLGYPLISLTPAKCASDRHLTQARHCLTEHNDVEMRNVAYRRLQVPFYEAYCMDSDGGVWKGHGFTWKDRDPEPSIKQLTSIAPVIATLAASFSAQKRTAGKKVLREVAKLIFNENCPLLPEIRDALKRLLTH